MIDPALYPFYITYGVVSLVLFLLYLRVKSSEAIVITTKEFKKFQNAYLIGYCLSLLGELASNAFYFYIFSEYGIESTVRLYLTSIISTTFFSIFIEMVDIGSRKNKTIFSAVLYTLATLTILSQDHNDIFFIGRIIYGAAAAFHHSSFESYVVNQHTSLGFPEEWLAQTFTILTHCMSFLAAFIGTIGQMTASSGGVHATVLLCIFLFATTAMYIQFSWTKDIASPKFSFGTFASNFVQTVNTARRNKPLLYLIVISAFSETAFTVFSYYWAQMISAMVKDENIIPPFALIFSSYVCTSMIGAYIHSLYANKIGSDIFFQGILSGLVASFTLASMVQTPLVIFLSSLVVYGFIGAYWPCIGSLRGKSVGAEHRSSSQLISRSINTILTYVLLSKFHYSAPLILIACAVCIAIAAYVQSLTMQQDGITDHRKKETSPDTAA